MPNNKKPAMDEITLTPELIRKAEMAAANYCGKENEYGYMRKYGSAAHCIAVLNRMLDELPHGNPSGIIAEGDADRGFDRCASGSEKYNPEKHGGMPEELFLEKKNADFREDIQLMENTIRGFEFGYYIHYYRSSPNEFEAFSDHIQENLPFDEHCKRSVSGVADGVPASEHILARADELMLAYYDGTYTAKRCRKVMADAVHCISLSEEDKLLIAIMTDYFSDLAREHNTYEPGSCSDEAYLKSTYIGLRTRRIRVGKLMKKACDFYSKFDPRDEETDIPCGPASIAQSFCYPGGYIYVVSKENILNHMSSCWQPLS